MAAPRKHRISRAACGIGALLALAVGGCRSAGGEKALASDTTAPVPRGAAAPTDATPPWQRRIQGEVSALRGLPFKSAVGYGVQSREDFRHFVRGEMQREMPGTKVAALQQSYAQMGLLDSGFDLGKALEEALTTQVAAYYDPRRKALWVLGNRRTTADGPQRDDEIVAHELEHALQDQHFDLEAFDAGRPGETLDEDERMARHFVVEGEAMFVMLAWQMGSGAGGARQLGPLAVAGLRMSVAMLAAGDLVDMLAGLRQGGAELPAEARAEVEALVKLPPVIVSPLIDPYLKGALLVSEAWGRGGWPAVDDLFRHPPQSTEQALHPLEKFLQKRDAPVHIQAPAQLPPVLATATPLASEVLGELGWRIYFKTNGQPDGEQAAAGWGGDRYWSFQIGGLPVVLTATRWDSPADAHQFFDAYVATLARRFPRAGLIRGADEVRLTRPGGGLITVHRRGLDVDIVDGARPGRLPALAAYLRAAPSR